MLSLNIFLSGWTLSDLLIENIWACPQTWWLKKLTASDSEYNKQDSSLTCVESDFINHVVNMQLSEN